MTASFLQRHRRKAQGLLLLILGLAVLRLALATIIKTVANHELAHMERYRGHIDQVGLSLWRGAYQFNDLKIETWDGKVPLPLFSVRSMDIGLQWKALFRHQWVASVELWEPRVNFVTGPKKDQSQTGKEQNWATVMQRLVPLKINRVEVHQGEVHFSDPYSKSALDVRLEAVNGEIDNLRSRRPVGGSLPSSLSVTAKASGGARTQLKLNLDPFAEKPTFDYAFILTGLDLTAMNPLLLRYLGIDVARGEVSVYSEGRSDAGKFKGYVKPLVARLKVMKPKEKLGAKFLKKSAVGLVGWIFKDHSQDRSATKLQVSGDLGRPNVKVIPAFIALFQNAFIRPIPAKLDQESDLHEFKGE